MVLEAMKLIVDTEQPHHKLLLETLFTRRAPKEYDYVYEMDQKKPPCLARLTAMEEVFIFFFFFFFL